MTTPEPQLKGNPNRQAELALQLLDKPQTEDGMFNRRKRRKTKTGWVRDLTDNETNKTGRELVDKLIEHQVLIEDGTNDQGYQQFILRKDRLKKWISQTDWYRSLKPYFKTLLDHELEVIQFPVLHHLQRKAKQLL